MRYPVFIVGMPRSGTTLLSAMVDAHPDVAISPETHFYTRCRWKRGPAVLPGGTGRERPVEEVWACVQQQPGFGDADFSDAEVEAMERRIFASASPRPADVLAAVESVYAERADAVGWGEKTPDHLRHVPTIFRDFPDAVVVAIVRDPRDVCRSLQDLPWNRDTLAESAWTWRRYARLTHRYRLDYPERFRMVRYEDLLDTPEAVVHDVLRWMEAEVDAEVLDRVLRFHERESGPANREREPWKGKTRRPIDPSNKEKWRTQMPPAERWIVQRLTRPLLGDFGYDAPPVALGPAFWQNLAEVLLRTARTLWNRLQRRLTPSGGSGDDYRPEWMQG